jgi:L-lysine exporter family protein LysE/ArgO
VSFALGAALAGFGLGLSLIVAIGAQNLFVLRQGIRRAHVGVVALICAVSDAALIALGVSGVGLVLHAVPWLIVAVRWAGAVFLVGYGLLAARRAWRPSGAALGVGDGSGAIERVDDGEVVSTPRTGLAATVATCLALTWLNPHVYLDTVFLLGGVAATHGDARWWFALGAMVASVIWFTGLAYGARWAGRWLARPGAWRVLDAIIAVVMIGLGVSLVLGL